MCLKNDEKWKHNIPEVHGEGKEEKGKNEGFTGLAFEGCYFSDESHRLPIDQPVPQW